MDNLSGRGGSWTRSVRSGSVSSHFNRTERSHCEQIFKFTRGYCTAQNTRSLIHADTFGHVCDTS